VYACMCLCNGQYTFSLHVTGIEWLCVTRCSVMYQTLTLVLTKRIMAGHWFSLLDTRKKARQHILTLKN
jgi:hypothetical protein